ncbi:hypothetical protein [Pseudomonas phage ANB1]|nr:hypothetical protein [Pseudomonas phage ANB1]
MRLYLHLWLYPVRCFPLRVHLDPTCQCTSR